MNRWNCWKGWIGLVLVLVLVPARAQAEDDPVKAGLAETARAYEKLDAYADEGVFFTRVESGGRTEERTEPVALSLVRPNRLSVRTRLVRLATDGATLTTTVVPFKKFVKGPAPKRVDVETLRAGPLGSVLFGGPHGRAASVLAAFLLGPDPVAALPRELGGAWKSEPDRPSQGVKCRAFRLSGADGADYRLLVDPDTRLIREIDVVATPDEAGPLRQFGWRSGPISTGPPAAEAFAVEPPAGYSAVEPYTAEGAPDEKKHRVEDLVGKPAPDFALTVLDDPGKFRKLTRADLAGQVVVLDFWATWCGPCLAELPEIQKLIESYGKKDEDKGAKVVIVAVSQDQRPSELGDVRKLVENTLDRKQIRLTASKVGRIALDPSGTVGEAFEVEALPTLVLIDPRGVIRAAHVGFHEDIGKVLGKEIEKLRAGKP